MKLGYSNLLGELLQAEKIDYTDCKNFQIVCPNCKEPIFKVNRNQEEEKSLHYLSHYNKDKSYNLECELRVNGLSKIQIETENTLSRNQRLKYFLKVLQKTIAKRHYGVDNIEIAIKNITKLNSNPYLKLFRDFEFNTYLKYNIASDEEDFFSQADLYINEIKNISSEFYSTQFSIDIQKRIAFDIWKTIYTPNGKPNYIFLFHHAYFFLLNRFRLAQNERKLYDWEIFLISRMTKLLECDVKTGEFIIQEISNYNIDPPFLPEKSSSFLKIITELKHEMVGTLLGLPYFEILRESMSKPAFEVPPNVKTF